jgi:hypothetical protein
MVSHNYWAFVPVIISTNSAKQLVIDRLVVVRDDTSISMLAVCVDLVAIISLVISHVDCIGLAVVYEL